MFLLLVFQLELMNTSGKLEDFILVNLNLFILSAVESVTVEMESYQIYEVRQYKPYKLIEPTMT